MISALDGIVVIASTANAGGIRDVEACGELLPRLGGAFDLRLAVSVPLPIVMGIFVLLWFQSRLT